MEKRLSYIIVGLFVMVITLSLFFFLFWLAKYGNKSIEHDYYNTYFTESVSGLNVESLVKLRGVEVGRVKKIAINKDNSEEVAVLLEIIKDTPIKLDSYTVLDSQGITGLKYIELKGGDNTSALLSTTKKDIATIPSKKSVMSNLFDSSESITAKIDSILDKVDGLLDVENRDNISKIVENISQITGYVDLNKYRLEKLLVNINKFLNQTMKFEEDILPTVLKVGDMSDKIGEMSDKAGDMSDRVGNMSDKVGVTSDTTTEFFVDMQKELDAGEFSVSTIVEENMQTLNEAIRALRDLSIKLESTVDSLKESPSDILYKSNKKILGPGESHE